ncbi:hypothetical protein TNCV_1952141 [Trichonephila clavipes]|nr:hypothetical protein TNCV_1952141 [Trichonephila clavipes]
MHWPSRSVGSIPCLDYLLWGYVKSLVYDIPVNSDEDLVARIAAAVGKNGAHPEFSPMFKLQYTGDLRPVW